MLLVLPADSSTCHPSAQTCPRPLSVSLPSNHLGNHPTIQAKRHLNLRITPPTPNPYILEGLPSPTNICPYTPFFIKNLATGPIPKGDLIWSEVLCLSPVHSCTMARAGTVPFAIGAHPLLSRVLSVPRAALLGNIPKYITHAKCMRPFNTISSWEILQLDFIMPNSFNYITTEQNNKIANPYHTVENSS